MAAVTSCDIIFFQDVCKLDAADCTKHQVVY